MDKVRVAFIGAGNRARHFIHPTVRDLSEMAEVVAVCDLDEDKLNQCADDYGVQARYTDLHRMLDEVELDACFCITPPAQSFETVMPCLQAGRHVLTEKPLGISSEQAQQMADAAEAHGCVTLVGFNRRYTPVIEHCRRLVEERGGPTQVVAEFHKYMLGMPPYYDMSIMITDVIHSVDFIRHLMGDPAQVHSAVRRRYNDWDNIFNALLTWDDGGIAVLMANRASGARIERFEIHGRGIACYLSPPDRAEIWVDDEKEPTIVTGQELTGSDAPYVLYGCVEQSRHFFECIRDGRRPLSNFADAARSMRLCETIEEGAL
ncbi:MAG: Gfo/Idh/MocA family oxidoreductase [Armatimonadetes bacterium]|nr:Gfo/Idh/MocA family oxidoreductase [Armatimonadota bacterium]